jgi:hypothetical protein
MLAGLEEGYLFKLLIDKSIEMNELDYKMLSLSGVTIHHALSNGIILIENHFILGKTHRFISGSCVWHLVFLERSEEPSKNLKEVSLCSLRSVIGLGGSLSMVGIIERSPLLKAQLLSSNLV